MPDLCPYRSRSQASRNIMFAIPEESYYKDPDSPNINLTIQSMWAAVVEDLNKLADTGIQDPSTGESW